MNRILAQNFQKHRNLMQKTLIYIIFSLLTLTDIVAQTPQWRNFLYPEPTTISHTQGSKIFMATRKAGFLELDTRTEVLRHFQPDNSPIRGVDMLSLFPESDSIVWVSTRQFEGLQRLNVVTKTATYLTKRNNNEAIKLVTNIRRDNRGRLWMLEQGSGANKAQLTCFDGQNWQVFLKDSLVWSNLERFGVDSSGMIWLYSVRLSIEGVQRYNPVTRTLQPVRIPNFDASFTDLQTVEVDKNRAVWLTWMSNDRKNFRVDKFAHDVWASDTFRNNYESTIHQFCFDRNNEPYCVNQAGVYTLIGGRWKEIPTPYVQINGIAFGENNSNWMLSKSLNTPVSISKWLKDSVLRTFTVIDSTHLVGVENPEVWRGIHPKTQRPLYNEQDFDGRSFKRTNVGHGTAYEGDTMWITAANTQGLLRYTPQSGYSLFAPTNGATMPRIIQKMVVDSARNKWLMTAQTTGIYKIDRQDRLLFYPIPASFNLQFGYYWDFAVDKKGDIWLSADTLLLNFEATTTQWKIIPSLLGRDNYKQVATDTTGNVWLSNNTHYFYKNGTWSRFLILDLKGSINQWTDGHQPTNPRWMVYHNKIWWFLSSYGLTRYDGTIKVQHFNATNSPLPVNNAYGLSVDASGNLWLAHNNGLTVFNELGLRNLGSVSTQEVSMPPLLSSSVVPNPLIINGLLKFENPNSEFFLIQIFDIQGRLVLSKKTNADQIPIERGTMLAGLYVYTIQGGGQFGVGKFVVE
jgi:ligand-binding sensor domain-containing protein